MRSLFVTILFFFGPVILMFVLRHLGLLLRLWLMYRRASRETEANVIDVTPRKPHPPSKWFIAVTILVGIGFAVLAYQRLIEPPAVHRHYVPAHTDATGHIIPGHYE